MAKIDDKIATESQDEAQVEDRIKKHKIKRTVWIIAISVVVLSVLIGYVVYRLTKKYTDYDVLNSVDKESRDNSTCIKYQDGFLKYDSNGIMYYDQDNKVVWQISYEMTSPQVKVCNDYVGIANIGFSQLYIADTKGLRKIIDTALPITQVEVTDVGACAVTLEDGQLNYIRMYDIKGNVLYDLKKIISGDGYPIDIAVSDDGTKLCVSGLYLDDTFVVPRTKLYFYNFSEVGKNEVDFYVGGYDYDMLVPDVRFLNNDLVVAVGDSGFMLYNMEEYPSLKAKVDVSYKIESLFINNGYIGLIHKDDEEKPYVLEGYNSKGKKAFTYRSEELYNQAIFMKDYIMLYNSNKAQMIDYFGKSRFEYTFDIPLQDVVWISGNDRFVFINAKSIQQIRLK